MPSELTALDWVERSFWTYSQEVIATPDGWRLCVHRFRPNRMRSAVPVVLIPGHGTSAWTYFGGEKAGIAGALAAAGRDVWLVDPRGCGRSRHPEKASPVRISDKLSHDLPTFFQHVLEITGAEQLDAVGHSLGGVLIYLYALSHADRLFRRAVTLGSPLRIPRAAVSPLLRTRVTEFLASRLGRVPLGRFTERIAKRIGARWMPVHFDPSGVAPEHFESFLRNGVCDVYGPELAELIRWTRTGDIASFQGGQRLERSRLPMPTRLLVGAGDVLTTPESVRHTYEQIGGDKCELHVLGCATGARHDYRHTDTLLGYGAPYEVAPLITGWLG